MIKKILFIISIALVYVTNIMADEIVRPHCQDIKVSYELTNDCCINIIIYTEYGNDLDGPLFLIEQYDNSAQTYETMEENTYSHGTFSATIKLCPRPGENTVKYLVKLASPHDKTIVYCDYPGYSSNVFVEGWTQHSGEVQLGNCCNCPIQNPLILTNYLTVTTEESELCPDQCRVVCSLDLPESMSCYTKYSFSSNWTDDISLLEKKSIDNYPLSNYDFCIANGESRNIRVFLYTDQGTQPTDACVLTADVSCDVVSLQPHDNPCILPCNADSPEGWQHLPSFIVENIENCTGCNIESDVWVKRKLCNGEWTLFVDIRKIEIIGDCYCFDYLEEFMALGSKSIIEELIKYYAPSTKVVDVIYDACFKIMNDNYEYWFEPCLSEGCCILEMETELDNGEVIFSEPISSPYSTAFNCSDNSIPLYPLFYNACFATCNHLLAYNYIWWDGPESKMNIGNITNRTLIVYPNPTDNKLTVEFDTNNETTYSINLIDIKGKVVLSKTINTIVGVNKIELDIKSIVAGSYSVTITNSQNSDLSTVKIIIK